MKLKFKQDHRHATGFFLKGTTYEIPDAVAERILQDFPDKVAKARGSMKTRRGKSMESPENK